MTPLALFSAIAALWAAFLTHDVRWVVPALVLLAIAAHRHIDAQRAPWRQKTRGKNSKSPIDKLGKMVL